MAGKTRRKSKKNTYILWGLIAFMVILVVGVYLFFSSYYNSHFYPQTYVNGICIGNKGIEDTQDVLGEVVESYAMYIKTRDGSQYLIDGTDFDYGIEKQGSLDNFLEEQNGFAWMGQAFKEHHFEIKSCVVYDENKLKNIVNNLEMFDEALITQPTDAYIEKIDGKLEVIPESQGNLLRKEDTVNYIVENVINGVENLQIPEEYYINPKVTSTSPEITNIMEVADRYQSASIEYDIGDHEEILTSEEIAKWIYLDENNEVKLNQEKVERYVQGLATKYNTYGDKREFKTTKGDTVVIGGGDYGWVINKSKEAAQIIADIETGQVIKREPIYSQTAVLPGTTDLGDTYLEIDYTNQHIYYYKEGKMVLDSDIVSGNLKKGNGSPDGIYKVVYKQSPAKLVGEDYASDVAYFVVFAYNVGVHDASWRSKFGGQIYKTSGSHGCVNVPKKFVAELYKIIEKDTPVVAYYREKVTLTTENARISNAYSYVADKK